MKNLFATLFFCLICNAIIAQDGRRPGPKPQGGGTPFIVKGKVIDAASGEAIDYATVVVNNKETGKIINGTTTSEGGLFQLRSRTPKVTVEVSFIGYTNIVYDEIKFDKKLADLGTIKLGEDAQALDEVVITETKSTTEFKLDKRVFNVGSDLSSTGASALEVLDNVPSVNVNIEGQISLRGASGVQILIDGKPSILADQAGNALGTITADMIEKVEVITNPSAKGVGYRSLPRFNNNVNRNKIDVTELTSDGIEYRDETFYNVILGSDFYINPLNVITLSGSFAYEIESQPSETDFSFSTNNVVQRKWTRTEETEALNPKYQYELQYKKDFEDDEDHQLLFSAIGRFFGKAQSSEFNNTLTEGVGELNAQTTETEFKEGKYTFNLDYTKPFNKEYTLETGAQYLTNDVSNDFSVSDEIDGVFVVNQGLTNTFEYDQKVLGIYSTGAYEGDIWGLKLGLRMENTDLETVLVNTNETNDQNFTNFFPTAHTSYKFSDAISFQAGYSRRIYRPRLWDLNPFFNIRNNFNVVAGNPNLLPEYTDSYEVGSVFIFDDISLNVNVYHRQTTDKIERVSTFVDNVNTFRPENIGVNRATGIELNTKYSLSRKITINSDLNYNVFAREGQFNDQNFDFSADKWSGKLTTKYKIKKGLDFEVTGRYQSRERTVQGIVSPNARLDAGLRVKILEGKGVFNLSARDIFASGIRIRTIDQQEFYVYSRNLRGRFLTLGFSYGFGKGEAMQYSGRRR